MRVAVLDDIHHAYEHADGIRRLRERAEVKVFTAPFGDPAKLRGFEALIANRERTRFTRELLEQLPDLKIIAQTGGHVYHIDLDAARERGIAIGKAMGGLSFGTIELAFGLMIAVMRQVAASDAALRQGEWPTPPTYVLHGKTLGVLGIGNLGGEVARLGNAFGMRVLAWSQNLTDERAARLLAAVQTVGSLSSVRELTALL